MSFGTGALYGILVLIIMLIISFVYNEIKLYQSSGVAAGAFGAASLLIYPLAFLIAAGPAAIGGGLVNMAWHAAVDA